MNRKIKSIGLSLLFFALLFQVPVYAEPDKAAQYSGFHVKGRFLYDANENKVTLIGVNSMIIYWDDAGSQSFPNIRKTGANVARIFWNVDSSIQNSKFDATIDNAIKNKLIPVPGVWNATGKWAQLDTCVNWWLQKDIVDIIKKYEKYMIVNIANEAGTDVPKDEWESKYKEIITKFRNAGIRVPLMIDTGNWGRDESYILEKGKSLVDFDPDHNIIFSWHPWDENQPRSRYHNAFDKAVKQDLCMIVGEFAHVGVNYDKPIDWKSLVEEALSFEIGWLPWSWRGASESDGHNLTIGYSIDNLTDWGREIVPYIEQNAVRASIFSPDKKPAAPMQLTVAENTEKLVKLEWKPSGESGEGLKYEIYRNGTKIFTSEYTTYIDRLIKPGTDYSYSVKAINSEGISSESSNAVNVKIASIKKAPKPQSGKDEKAAAFWGVTLSIFALAGISASTALIYMRKKKVHKHASSGKDIQD